MRLATSKRKIPLLLILLYDHIERGSICAQGQALSVHPGMTVTPASESSAARILYSRFRQLGIPVERYVHD